jgi:tetratricopeptide (TPR) repeat protein
VIKLSPSLLLLLCCLAGLAKPAVADDSNNRCFSTQNDAEACGRLIASGKFQGSALAKLRIKRAFTLSSGGASSTEQQIDLVLEDLDALKLLPPMKEMPLSQNYAWQGVNWRRKADFAEFRGDERALEKSLDRAKTLLDGAIGLKNTNINDAWYQWRAEIELRRGQYAAALQDMDKALSYPNPFIRYVFIRAKALNGLGRLDEAFTEINKYIEKCSDCADAFALRASIWFEKRNFRQAIVDYTAALNIDGNAQNFNARGEIFEAIKDTAHALEDYRAALKTTATVSIPENATARRNAEKHLKVLALAPNIIAPSTTASDQASTSWFGTFASPPATATAVVANSKPAPTGPLANSSIQTIATIPNISTPINPAGSVSASPKFNTDRRVALVIGNARYANQPVLVNPEHDANLVADVLKQVGFQVVTLHTNLTKDALTTALRNFAAQAENADWAVLYYSGHGMEVAGINYLIPIDARLSVDRDIGIEAVSLDQVLNAAERAKKLHLVILDACRTNPFKSQMRRTLTVASRGSSEGLAPPSEPEAGTLIEYAAKDGETALDGRGANSPFATALVRNLQIPGLEVRRMFDSVRDDVMEMTDRNQKPFSYGSISGRQDFFFVSAR